MSLTHSLTIHALTHYLQYMHLLINLQYMHVLDCEIQMVNYCKLFFDSQETIMASNQVVPYLEKLESLRNQAKWYYST